MCTVVYGILEFLFGFKVLRSSPWHTPHTAYSARLLPSIGVLGACCLSHWEQERLFEISPAMRHCCWPTSTFLYHRFESPFRPFSIQTSITTVAKG